MPARVVACTCAAEELAFMVGSLLAVAAHTFEKYVLHRFVSILRPRSFETTAFCNYSALTPASIARCG